MKLTRQTKAQKAGFDAQVTAMTAKALRAFQAAGMNDAEDMAQDIALRLYSQRVEIARDDTWKEDADTILSLMIRDAISDARSRARGMRLMDLEAAVCVPEPSTPYHFLIAQEIAGVAESLDLDSHMMGDTVEDEAEHYGVSRQRAHQIINERRFIMSEYLET